MTTVALRLGVAIAMLVSPAAREQTPVARPSSMRVVESIDLGRYAGRWFEIARLPNPMQSACDADVTVRYALRTDGRLDVITACRTIAGTLTETRGLGRKLAQGGSDARLQLRFVSGVRALFGAGWTDYWILGIGPDYTWAVAGSPSRDRLWILSRTPEMSPSSYEQAEVIARSNGFDVTRVVKTKQSGQ